MSPCNHRITLTHTKTHTHVLSIALSLSLSYSLLALLHVFMGSTYIGLAANYIYVIMLYSNSNNGSKAPLINRGLRFRTKRLKVETHLYYGT